MTQKQRRSAEGYDTPKATSGRHWFWGTVIAGALTALGSVLAALLNHSSSPPPSPQVTLQQSFGNNGNLVSGNGSITNTLPALVPAAPSPAPAISLPASPPSHTPDTDIPPCKQLDPSNDMQAILRRFGKQAVSMARTARTGRSVIVRSGVGEQDLGLIAPNTRVRLICMAESGFVLIKKEQGEPNGVVESSALE